MSNLADVRDIDCLVSFDPIAFDLSSAFVVGADAIMRRILYRWCQLLGSVRHAPTLGVPVPLLDADGVTLAPNDVAGLRASLRKQAKAESFVKDAAVKVTLSEDGRLSVAGLIQLVDGKTYPLEVGPAEAIGAFALIAIGEATA